jgi:hypothetical protein
MAASGDLEARVAKLERQTRVAQGFGVFALLVAASAWLVPGIAPVVAQITVDTLNARQIYVRGVGGFISISTDPIGATIDVAGPSGDVPLVAICTDKQSAAVRTFAVSKAVVAIGYSPNEAGAIRAYDDAANPIPAWSAP